MFFDPPTVDCHSCLQGRSAKCHRLGRITSARDLQGYVASSRGRKLFLFLVPGMILRIYLVRVYFGHIIRIHTIPGTIFKFRKAKTGLEISGPAAVSTFCSSAFM